MTRRYIYRDHVLYVKSFTSVNTVNYGVFFVDRKGYERILYISGELSIRHTMEDAQRDLDAFAEKRGLREAKAA